VVNVLGFAGIAYAIVAPLITIANGAAPTGGYLEYGALGLCAIMILQSGAERRKMVSDVNKQQELLVDLARQAISVIGEVKLVMERCAAHGLRQIDP
jgi:hypothetical protein